MRKARAAPERVPAAAAPGVADALVDRVHRAGAAFQQRGEDHQLEQQAEQRQVEALQQEVRRQRDRADLRVVGHHAAEEQQRRQHRQGAGDQAGDDRVAVAGQVTQHRQDHHRADDVVAGIGHPAGHPAVHGHVLREACDDQSAEVREREHAGTARRPRTAGTRRT